MATPRRRQCSTRQAKRRTHVKVHPPQLVPCEECGQLKHRHRICPSCGTYKKVSYKAKS